MNRYFLVMCFKNQPRWRRLRTINNTTHLMNSHIWDIDKEWTVQRDQGNICRHFLEQVYRIVLLVHEHLRYTSHYKDQKVPKAPNYHQFLLEKKNIMQFLFQSYFILMSLYLKIVDRNLRSHVDNVRI